MQVQTSHSLLMLGFLTTTSFAQGQVVSYYARQTNVSELAVIPQVPASGLVVTDVIYGENRLGQFELVELQGTTRTTKAGFWMTNPDSAWQLRSGIPLTPGASLLVVIPSADTIGVTVSGYVPGGSAPALGGAGLVFLAIVLLGAGGLIIRSRQDGQPNVNT